MKWILILLVAMAAVSLVRIVTQLRKAARPIDNDWDARFIGQMRKAGITAFETYPVDFFFGLPSAEACARVAAVLEPDGYVVDSRQDPEGSGYSLHANRPMRLLVPDMQALTAKFRELAAEHGGKYDGWTVAKDPRTNA